ncbi:outer membrane beta-barrel protein [Hyphomicrobium sp. D-2]|uniref:outer membrane protein n=1 Tax=Hyphomicrobium sp. D-2 TaxID=3041621 RepID=UPI0024555A80|nr:outer membrane beta-barrel protein [Hyphomicrobium sp. D-2]MDH4982645.1 outer membrane beta-barrel protein [Hyphomicrobium sp. D-2]
MNCALKRISLALAVGVGMIAPMASMALADGDPYYSNGINPSGIRTPVPAPIPVPVYEAEWYFRGDFAAGFGGSPSVNVLGANIIEQTFGNVGRENSFEPSFTGGVGVGYVWGPYFRTDLTVDMHSIMSTKQTASAVIGGNTVSAVDRTKWMSTILMLNGYYDIRTGTPWTPYIGGGLGFAVNQGTRNVDYTNTGVGSFSTGDRSTQVQFAGAAMVGLTYEFSSFWALDVNYRFLHVGGPSVSSSPNYASTVEFGSLNEHQIRAGLRFYVN